MNSSPKKIKQNHSWSGFPLLEKGTIQPYVEYLCRMTVAQRFLRYFIGFIIGLAVVAMMFPEYNWLSWTPQQRIMRDIREFKMEIGPEASCSMTCNQITPEHLQIARVEGEVDFGTSQVRVEPKIYHLNYGHVQYTLALADSTFTLRSVVRENQSCVCP